MKKMIKVIIVCLVALLNIVSDTGCWNYREINDIAIVSGVSVDKNEETDEYVLTFEVVNTKGVKEAKNVPDIVTMQGKTIFDAVRNAIEKLGRRLYWSHAKVFIISQSIAKNGVAPVLDFIYRDAEVRSDIWLLISEDETAADILRGNDKYHDTLSYHIDEEFRNEKNTSKYVATELWKFVNDLSDEGISPTISAAKIATKGDEKVPMIVGTAVFKKDKMVGTLDLNDTKYFLLAADEYKKGVIAIPDVTENVREVTLEVLNSNTKSKPVLKSGVLGIKVDIDMDVDIAEIMGGENLVNEKGREKVKKKAQEEIKKKVEGVIKKAQTEYKSDIFGFGSIVKREMPDFWKKTEHDWDDIFCKMSIDVNVEVNIKGSALNMKSIKIGD